MYVYTKRTTQSFTAVEQRLRAALAMQGFGIITQIDVQKTIKAKLGKDVASYLILGACNPVAAHQAMNAEPDIGVLLPCNVVIRAEENITIVSAIRPTAQLGKIGNPALLPIAADIERRITRAVDETVAGS